MPLQGTFQPPGDKSISHRIVLFSLLAQGRTRVENLALGQDVRTSLRIVEALGGFVGQEKGRIVIQGPGDRMPEQTRLGCGNSGTTIRLLMGLLAGRPGEYVLDGDESLRRRPMERIAQPLRSMGARIDCREGGCPVRVQGGPLDGITYDLPIPSAQLKSAVLLAGLRAKGRTQVREPAPSRDHTERMIKALGGRIDVTGGGVIRVEPSALTLPPQSVIPGDISSAAFFLCAAAIIPSSRVTAQGVLLNPTRIGFLNVLRRMGADLKIEPRGETPEPWGDITVRHKEVLCGCRITPEEIPGLIDEVPILALVATQARGRTVFEDIRELRHKESDRVSALLEQLGSMGAELKVSGNRLTVNGPTRLVSPPNPDSLGDHRMAMTLRLALLLADGDGPIRGEDCAGVSYPGFRNDLARLLR